METGNQANKDVTARSQAGMSNSGAGTSPSTAGRSASVATPGNPMYSGESESSKTLGGPNDGIAATASPGKSQKWGYSSPSGNAISVDDTPGGETISLQHQTGAHVVVEPDGAIYIISASRKGVGISAPFGDAYIHANGDVVIDGATLSLKSRGDIILEAQGNIIAKALGMMLQSKTFEQVIDGSASYEITNDVSTIIGGVKRDTIAGDYRSQVTGSYISDIGVDYTVRVTGNTTINTSGAFVTASTGNTTIASKASILIDADGTINTITPTYNLIANMVFNGHLGLAGSLDASGTVKSMGVMGSEAYLIAPTSNAGSPGTASVSAPSAEGFGGEIVAAEVMEAEDVVDHLTSVRKYPDFPENARHLSADGASIYTHSDDYTTSANEVYSEYAQGNQGNELASSAESFANIPVSQITGEGVAPTDAPYSVPSQENKGVKISRFFTLGELINAKHSHRIPPGKYQEIVQNHILAAYNVLDPIREKFPDMIITSAYRNNSKNHVTGRAIDIVVQSRSLDRHAEIALFVANNLPVDQVFIEKNTSGRTHVHIRVSPSGQKTKPVVLTCGDPQCRTKTPGIDVQYLRRKGVA